MACASALQAFTTMKSVASQEASGGKETSHTRALGGSGHRAAAQESWQQARSELEPFLKEQPENYSLMGDLTLTNMGLGDKAAALALAERAMAVNPHRERRGRWSPSYRDPRPGGGANGGT